MAENTRAVVLGASGSMGQRVARRLDALGYEVVPASRSTGVDAATGKGLAEAFEGTAVVVDCLNLMTIRRREAVDFFTTSAQNVTESARAAGVRHLIVVSIVNVADERATKAVGYYAGKAAQEDAYRAGSVPVSVVATTAWFELAEQFLNQIRVGPVALVPAMTLQPVHPDAAADLIAEVAQGEPPQGAALHQLAGPERMTAAEMARVAAPVLAPGARVVGIPVPPKKSAREQMLLPQGPVEIDPRTLSQWLAERQPRP